MATTTITVFEPIIFKHSRPQVRGAFTSLSMKLKVFDGFAMLNMNFNTLTILGCTTPQMYFESQVHYRNSLCLNMLFKGQKERKREKNYSIWYNVDLIL